LTYCCVEAPRWRVSSILSGYEINITVNNHLSAHLQPCTPVLTKGFCLDRVSKSSIAKLPLDLLTTIWPSMLKQDIGFTLLWNALTIMNILCTCNLALTPIKTQRMLKVNDKKVVQNQYIYHAKKKRKTYVLHEKFLGKKPR
jgi:hypothetical protein